MLQATAKKDFQKICENASMSLLNNAGYEREAKKVDIEDMMRRVRYLIYTVETSPTLSASRCLTTTCHGVADQLANMHHLKPNRDDPIRPDQVLGILHENLGASIKLPLCEMRI